MIAFGAWKECIPYHVFIRGGIFSIYKWTYLTSGLYQFPPANDVFSLQLNDIAQNWKAIHSSYIYARICQTIPLPLFYIFKSFDTHQWTLILTAISDPFEFLKGGQSVLRIGVKVLYWIDIDDDFISPNIYMLQATPFPHGEFTKCFIVQSSSYTFLKVSQAVKWVIQWHSIAMVNRHLRQPGFSLLVSKNTNMNINYSIFLSFFFNKGLLFSDIIDIYII